MFGAIVHYSIYTLHILDLERKDNNKISYSASVSLIGVSIGNNTRDLL